MKKITVGLIGAGNMGQAIVKGLSAQKDYQVCICDRDEKKAQAVSRKHKVKKNNLECLTKESNIIIICVKPQGIDELLEWLRTRLLPGQSVVSIAAGIRLDRLEKKLGFAVPVIRVMPNMPGLIGKGVSAYCLGKKVRPSDEKNVVRIFSSIGEVLKVKSEQMDAITALTGSGPGFAAYLLEGMISAAVKIGFDPETAAKLSLKTFQGTIDLIEQTGISPKELALRVASKGGTTEAGLNVLKSKKAAFILEQTLKAAVKRAKELSK